LGKQYASLDDDVQRSSKRKKENSH